MAGLPLEATVALADLAGAVKEGLLGFCADVGLMVMAQMLEAEMTARVGPKHAKIPGRPANWHGTTTARSCWAAARYRFPAPGPDLEDEEIELDTWAAFSLQGSARPADGGADAGGGGHPPPCGCGRTAQCRAGEQAKATGRSSVSRRFKRATEAALAELMARICPAWRWR